MNEAEIIERRLGGPVAAHEVSDCVLTFRRQHGSRDVWCVATGPLGMLAFRVIEDRVLRDIQAARHGGDIGSDRSLGRRTRGWPRVAIDDDFVIAMRAYGDRLVLAFLSADEAWFGSGHARLPTLRRPTPLERVRLWAAGVRGGGRSK